MNVLSIQFEVCNEILDWDLQFCKINCNTELLWIKILYSFYSMLILLVVLNEFSNKNTF